MDIHAPAGTGINAATAEERIKARQERIKQRLLRRKQKLEGKVEASFDPKQKELEAQQWDAAARQQVRASREAIDRALDKASAAITGIRVAGDGLEADRRHAKEQQRDDRVFKLTRLQEQSDEANAAIALLWSTLLQATVPQELLQSLMSQKSRCDDVIASKDNMIGSLTAELDDKDDEYVRELKRQAEQVDALLGHMATKFKELQKTYDTELAALDETFERELASLDEHNMASIEARMDERARLEERYTAERLQLLRDNQDSIEALHRKHGEDLNIVTVSLQTSVQILRQQLEEMRATYALNSQKLDYNIKILERREYENSITISQQKRKVNALTDQVTALRAKYDRQDAAYRADNTKLTAAYRRITDQYKELQRKYRHFQLSDAKRFKDVWDMAEEAVAKVVGRCLQADKLICEQQLGLPWAPPTEDVFQLRAALDGAEQGRHSAASTGGGGGSASGGGGGGGGPAGGHGFSPSGSPAPRSMGSPGSPGSPGSGGGGGGEGAGGGVSVLTQGSTDLARRILRLICDEAGFLVEEKVHALLEPLERDDQSQLMVKSIFKALKITRRTEIDRLLSYFVQDPEEFESRVAAATAAAAANAERSSSSSGSGSDSAGSESGSVARPRGGGAVRRQLVDAATIAPEEVVGALRQFVQDHNRELDRSRHSTKRSTSLLFMREQKQRSRQAEKDYWVRLGELVPAKTYRVWQSLEKAMVQYNEVLEARASLSAETDAIRAQNNDLKRLLNQYLSQGVNDELYVPPMATNTLRQ